MSFATETKADPMAPPIAMFFSIENVADIFDTAAFVFFIAPSSPVVN
jgi:hypothetical protein